MIINGAIEEPSVYKFVVLVFSRLVMTTTDSIYIAAADCDL